ncbi:hypothetical protein JAAARDRAFT_502717 [Jaapia argillacea MUCL 33604]|uniref:DUF7918 domain-containing protein n=1 Tax=Jaapia argillacea MUCL 33604 TaxID=933084 RepID=A0A067PA94_9AGAM|nr:hypothetical protein JAAARDRAFT_502717 [Jaapia argillacea MUCL 33604]
MRHSDVQAWVTIDGEELPEYQLAPRARRRKSPTKCWIQSEAGETFTVHWKDLRHGRLLFVKLLIDGVLVDGGLITINPKDKHSAPLGCQLDSNMCRTFFHEGFPISEGKMRYFVFSHLLCADNDEKNHSKLGTIELRISKATICPNIKLVADTLSPNADPTQKRNTASGKVVACQGHCVQPGDEVEDRPTTYFEGIKTGKKPFVTFIFRYRPKDPASKSNPTAIDH